MALYAKMAGSLNDLLLVKLHDEPCFGIQFNETSDLTRQAQVIAYVCFPNKECMKVVNHYLFYLHTGIAITAVSTFAKLANSFSEHGMTWLKCKAVSIDGARAMVDIQNGTVVLSRL